MSQVLGPEGGVPDQPTKLESFFAITKSLIIRALIIYFVSSFLRRPSSTTEVSSNESAGTQTATRVVANNFFQNGTSFDLHVYISEDQFEVNFSDSKSLVWFQKDLVYGDWHGGHNGDGSITYHTNIRASGKLQVCAFVCSENFKLQRFTGLSATN